MEMFGVPMGMAKLYEDFYEYEGVKNEICYGFFEFPCKFLGC